VSGSKARGKMSELRHLPALPSYLKRISAMKLIPSWFRCARFNPSTYPLILPPSLPPSLNRTNATKLTPVPPPSFVSVRSCSQ